MPTLLSNPLTDLIDDDWFSRRLGSNLLAPFTSGFFRKMQNELTRVIQADVAEDPNGFTITAELPGFRKEDIHIQINENVVTISAESKQEEVEEPKEAPQGKGKTRLLYRGRQYGAFVGNYALPSSVNTAECKAKYENGILTLTLPKQVTSPAHQLTVE